MGNCLFLSRNHNKVISYTDGNYVTFPHATTSYVDLDYHPTTDDIIEIQLGSLGYVNWRGYNNYRVSMANGSGTCNLGLHEDTDVLGENYFRFIYMQGGTVHQEIAINRSADNRTITWNMSAGTMSLSGFSSLGNNYTDNGSAATVVRLGGDGWTLHSSTTIYYVKVTSASTGKEKHYYKPCKNNSTNEVGFYDTHNKSKFFGNGGSGTLTLS